MLQVRLSESRTALAALDAAIGIDPANSKPIEGASDA
jgi:hypothetical protein